MKIALAAAAVLLAIGAPLLVTGIVTGNQSVGRGCGSVFGPDHFGARIADTLAGARGDAEARCIQHVDDKRTTVVLTTTLGSVFTVGGLVALAVGGGLNAQRTAAARRAAVPGSPPPPPPPRS